MGSEAVPDAPPRPSGRGGVGRRRQHPLAPLLRLQGVGQALLAGLVAGGSSGGGPLRLLTLVPVLVLIAVRTGGWAATFYEVDGGVLRFESGVLTRRRREVPLDRVQQVDVRRGLRHRLFGLCQLTVDAAGGSGGEVTLVLSDGEAARLRTALTGTALSATAPTGDAPAAAADAGGGTAAVPPSGPVPLVRLRAGELALAGVTGAKQLVMLALLGSVFQLVDDVPAGVRDAVADRLPTGTGWLVVAAVAALPAWCALAALAQLATDFRFTLTSDGLVLQVRRGFPTEREASLGLDRVQMARIDQTVLRRRLGLVSVQVAAAGSGQSAEAQVSRLTVPILRRDALDALVDAVLPGAVPLPPLVAPPPVARRRQILRRVVPAGAVAAVAAALLWPWGLVALLLVPAAAAAGELAYRGLGHGSSASHVVARRGGLWRRTAVVALGRTQSAGVRQSLLQRRAGLATLTVDVAGRGNQLLAVDLPHEDALRLARGAATAAAARADERARRRGIPDEPRSVR